MVCFDDAAQGEHGEHGEGIELMPQMTPHGSPKIPAAYTVVNLPPSDSGYDTDATAFSEGAFSDNTEDEDDDGDETGSLLGSHHGELLQIPHKRYIFTQ